MKSKVSDVKTKSVWDVNSAIDEWVKNNKPTMCAPPKTKA